MSKVAQQGKGRKKGKYETRNPLVAKGNTGYNSEESQGLLGDGRILVHSVEQRHIRKNCTRVSSEPELSRFDGLRAEPTSGVVDLGWADQDISIYSSERVPDHLGSQQEAYAPTRVDLATVVQFQRGQRSKT